MQEVKATLTCDTYAMSQPIEFRHCPLSHHSDTFGDAKDSVTPLAICHNVRFNSKTESSMSATRVIDNKSSTKRDFKKSSIYVFANACLIDVVTSEVGNERRDCQGLCRCRGHRVTFLVLTIATWLALAAEDAWRSEQEKGRRHKKQYPKTGEYSNDLQAWTAQLYHIVIMHSLEILLRINTPQR